MTFGDFARNYLNPFYLLFRCGFLMAGGWALFIALFSLNFAWWMKLVLGALGLWLLWTGIRPWGRGTTLNELNQAAEQMRRR